MDAPGVGIGQNEAFYFRHALYSRRSPASTRPAHSRNASFDEGVHNMEILAAVAESAAGGGLTV
jgi:hypothetical protein